MTSPCARGVLFYLFLIGFCRQLSSVPAKTRECIYISIYKLLILENFYASKKLKKIVDETINLKNLNNNDLLLLAGYYFRVNDIDKFKTIIQKNLPNQFDKKLLNQSGLLSIKPKIFL